MTDVGLRRKARGLGWRYGLVGLLFAVGWYFAGPVVDFRKLYDADDVHRVGASMPPACAPAMIGFDCQTKDSKLLAPKPDTARGER